MSTKKGDLISCRKDIPAAGKLSVGDLPDNFSLQKHNYTKTSHLVVFAIIYL